MTRLLRITALLLAVVCGIAMAMAVLFADETLYGLRPHAVKPDLQQRTVEELLALSEHGSVTGVLTYDAWYKGRGGATGWFLLPVAQTPDATFAVNGSLDPAIAKAFGAGPRRCKGTGLPAKMIRAIEPARKGSAFLGRSTCARPKMDVAALIARSRPATRRTEMMDHATLQAFDAQNDPLRLRDGVEVWPTPYAYFRTLSLPLVWHPLTATGPGPIFHLTKRARELAETLHREGVVGVQVQVQHWAPQTIADFETALMPFARSDAVVLLKGIEARRIDFVVLCAPDQRAACDEVNVSELLPDVEKLRDPQQWQDALADARTAPENLMWRDILSEDARQRTALRAPAAEPRKFRVTWYDATAP